MGRSRKVRDAKVVHLDQGMKETRAPYVQNPGRETKEAFFELARHAIELADLNQIDGFAVVISHKDGTAPVTAYTLTTHGAATSVIGASSILAARITAHIFRS